MTYWIVLRFEFSVPASRLMLLTSFASGARTWVSRPAVEVASPLMPSMALPIVVRSAASPERSV